MNGVLFDRPARWGKSWQLYRHQTGTDSQGDPVMTWPEDPDYTAQAGSTGAVAWQVKEDSSTGTESGAYRAGRAVGLLYDSSVELAPFDRVAFDDALWEVRGVTDWPDFRRIEVRRVWA